MAISAYTAPQEGDLLTPNYLASKFTPLVNSLTGWDSGSVQTHIVSSQTGLWSFGTDSHLLPVAEFGSNKTVTMLIYAGQSISTSLDWNTLAVMNNNGTGDKLVFSIERNKSPNTVFDVNFRNASVEFGAIDLSNDSDTIALFKTGNTGNPHKVAVGVYTPASATSVAWSVRHTGEVLQYTAGGSAGYAYGVYHLKNDDDHPRFAVVKSGASILFGAGSTSTPDVALGRSAASVLKTDGVLHVAGLRSGITVKSANYTVALTDHTVSMDSTSTTTATLPDPSTCTGQMFRVKRRSAGTVMLDATSGASIDSALTDALATVGQVQDYQSYGSGYFKV